jgi:hypothetical protein
LKDLTITSSIAPVVRDGRSGVSCITVEGAYNQSNLSPVTKVNIILQGTNKLTYTRDWFCALQVNQGAQIHINAIDPNDNASGKLEAICSATPGPLTGGGAAIGAPNFDMNAPNTAVQGTSISSCGGTTIKTAGGNIIIGSGTITAQGGHGAGIGGGHFTYYNGIIIIYGGIVNASVGRHSAGIGSGCPSGTGVTACYAGNSAIIALPPCIITATGRNLETDPPDPYLALAGARYITYINDPEKPLITVRTEDYEPNATIYVDLTETPGLEDIFHAVFPEYSLINAPVGRTDASGTLQFHAKFEQPTTFFTTVSSTKPATLGRPYLPVTAALPNGGTVVLPLLGTDIAFTDYWSLPLWVGYTQAEARERAHRIRVEYNDLNPLTNVTYQLQDGIHFSTLIFLGADGVTEIEMPTTINRGDVFYIATPVDQGKLLGYYSDVLLINGRFQNVQLPGYIRVIGRQRVAYDDSHTNAHIKVTASPQSFTVLHPTTNTVTLTLNINHSGMSDALYEQFNVIARYLVTTEPDYDLAVAATPLINWHTLNVAATSGVDVPTTVFFSGISAGTYYIHWYAESGVAYAHSLTVTTPPRTYGGFGPYIISDPVDPGIIEGPSSACCGQTAALTGTAGTGGSGSYTYTWQSSPSSTGPWTDLSPSNSQNYTTGALTSTTYFRRQTTDGAEHYHSNVIQVTTVNPPQAAFSTTNSTTCGTTTVSSTVTFSDANRVFINLVSGGGSVSASTITGSGAPVTYTPALSSSVQNIVIAAVTNSSGITPCKADTVYWNITVLPNFDPGFIKNKELSICSDDAGEIIIADSIPAAGGDTSISYEWYKNGAAIPNSNTAGYSIPKEDRIASTGTAITYTRKAKDATCQTDFMISAGEYKLTVNPYSTAGMLITTLNTAICSGESAVLTVGVHSAVSNPVFKWYSHAEGGIPLHVGHKYKTDALKADATYYVSVSGSNYCEGSVRDAVKVTITCFTLHGTVFPLVFHDDDEKDAPFAIIARLYAPPPPGLPNPIFYLQNPNLSTPLYETTAVHYDGSVHVHDTPKNPGVVGSLINPGHPINWKIIGKEPDPGAEKDTTTLRPGEKGDLSVGHYTFHNVAPGDYILALSRAGFITRYTKITVVSGGSSFIKHRELIGGNVIGRMRIESSDINRINSLIGYSFGNSNYDARYDLNGDLIIDNDDLSLVKSYQGFHKQGYEDTHEWLMEYRQE